MFSPSHFSRHILVTGNLFKGQLIHPSQKETLTAKTAIKTQLFSATQENSRHCSRNAHIFLHPSISSLRKEGTIFGRKLYHDLEYFFVRPWLARYELRQPSFPSMTTITSMCLWYRQHTSRNNACLHDSIPLSAKSLCSQLEASNEDLQESTSLSRPYL